MIKKTTAVLLLFICGGISVFADNNQLDKTLNPLITGVPSLSIAPDARGGAMGDLGAATTPDVNSQYWNPAKYAFTDDQAGVSFSYTPWLRKLVSDINLAYVAGYYKIGDKQSVSASLRYFSLGQVELRDANGILQGDTKPSEFSLDVAYTRKLSESFSAGVTLRYIHSDLGGGMISDMWPADAFAADVAAFYTRPITLAGALDGKFSLGANISNIGSKVSYDKGNTKQFLPTNFRIGTSYEHPIDAYNTISINMDINKLLIPADTATTVEGHQKYSDISMLSGIFKSFGDKDFMKRIQLSIGAEYVYNKQFAVRAGYFYESELNGNRKYFTFGAGFKMNVFRLDAAYVVATSQTNPLDQTLRFTLGFDLDGIKKIMQ
jgi:hypothetical protein